MTEQNRKFTDEEIKKMILNSNTSMIVEGFEPSEENDKIFKEYVKGNITEDEALRRIHDIVKSFKKRV